MTTTITNDGNAYSAILKGRIDTTTADQFQKDVAPLLAAKGAQVEIDCSGLEYTSSQGLRIFLMLQKTISAGGGSLVLKGMRSAVREVFDITGFSSIIKII